MSQLHISKVAVACANLETLRRRQAARAVGGLVPVYTRFRPKRAEELIGGSIYWIIKHNVVARQTIISFDVDAESRKTIIRLDAELVRVAPQPRRAHQGWRYLGAEDAPSDFEGSANPLAALPPALVTKLVSLALI